MSAAMKEEAQQEEDRAARQANALSHLIFRCYCNQPAIVLVTAPENSCAAVLSIGPTYISGLFVGLPLVWPLVCALALVSTPFKGV